MVLYLDKVKKANIHECIVNYEFTEHRVLGFLFYLLYFCEMRDLLQCTTISIS